MKSSLGDWIRAKFSDPAENKKQPARYAELPRLPKHRRTLTPSSSHECLTYQHGFFNVFSVEVRENILLFAFGNRVLHMDLSFDHPMQALPRGHVARNHCGLNGLGPDFKKGFNLDEKKPKAWEWWGSVCHRNGPSLEWFDCSMDGTVSLVRPCMDRCRQGLASKCDEWPGNAPSNCQIGIMGWLLSCRQA